VDSLGEGSTINGVFQSSPDGDGVAFIGETSAGDEISENGTGSTTNQYVARRGAEGWRSEALTPPTLGANTSLCGQVVTLGAPYSLFSSDLSAGVVTAVNRPGLGSASNYCYAIPFVHQDGAFKPLVGVQPPDRPPRSDDNAGEHFGEATPTVGAGNTILITAQGSEDLSRIFFDANDALPVLGTSALDGDTRQNNVYEWSAGHLRLVNVYPDGSTAPGAIVGGPGYFGEQNSWNYPADTTHAVSADGSRVFWTGANHNLYLRQNHTTTLQLDEALEGASGPSGGGRFLTASRDGSVAFFMDCNRLTPESTANPSHGCVEGDGGGPTGFNGNDLYRYDLNAPSGSRLSDLSVDPSDPAGADVQGVVGASADGAYVYFVALGRLSSEPNEAGEEPTLGKPNLYVWHASTVSFVAQLSTRDNEENNGGGVAFGDWRGDLATTTARVTPDGKHLVFNSAESLTPYDSKGIKEVYLYSADTGRINCVSCDPTGAPPSEKALQSTGRRTGAILFPEHNNATQPHWVNDQGTRVFFNTFDPLVSNDTNHLLDVYEWEAPGAGSCVIGGAGYSSLNEGCLYLLSSGQGSDNSYFDDATPSGSDAFFTTRDQLARNDIDSKVDLYDAREGGGFPEALPCSSSGGCAGSEAPAPSSASPGTATFNGPGNSSGKSSSCTKGRAAKKGRCQRHPKKKKKANAHPRHAKHSTTRSNRGGSK
jgi:hypothetical protein